MPAHQRFGADDLLALDVDLGLIGEADLTLIERVAQLMGQEGARAVRLLQIGREGQHALAVLGASPI